MDPAAGVDAHSPAPWRLGREANVFDLEQISYNEILNVIRRKDISRFKYTIETNPAYGKYHWTGHRNCGIAFSPRDAKKFNNVCPVCRKQLTKGVEQRIDELADRPENFKPENTSGFIRLLPLSEIIGTVLHVDSLYAQKIWEIYNLLIERFGNEYAVIIDASREELAKIVNTHVAEAIIRVREERMTIHPGYDGVYGRLEFQKNSQEKKPFTKIKMKIKQRNLPDFM